MHRARLHHRLGVEGVQEGRRPCTAPRCRRASSSRQQLPEPVFTPSTKAAVGDHDENISFRRRRRSDRKRSRRTLLRDVSLALYSRGAAWAAARGIIIADTKF